MNKLNGIFLALTLLLFTSCDFFQNCVEAEGNNVMNELDLEEFHSIEISSSVNVIITHGPTQLVEVNAPQNYFELLNKEVKDGEWEISFDRCLKNDQKVDLFISIKDLNGLEISGSGNIIAEGAFHGDKIDLDINGSGSMQLDLHYKEVEVGIQGSGSINLMGESKRLEIQINGSGNVDAENLVTDVCSIETNGSGDSRVYVSHELTIQGNGSGNVYYRGQPREIDSKFNGSGELHQIE